MDAISGYVRYATDSIPSAIMLERVLRDLNGRFSTKICPQILDYYLSDVGNQYSMEYLRDSIVLVRPSQERNGLYEVLLENVETHKSGLPIAKIKDNISRIYYTNFDTGNIITTSSDSILTIMNVYNGVVKSQMPLIYDGKQFVLSDDGERMLVLTDNQTIKLYDISMKEYVDSIKFNNPISDIKQLSGSKYLAITTNGAISLDILIINLLDPIQYTIMQTMIGYCVQ